MPCETPYRQRKIPDAMLEPLRSVQIEGFKTHVGGTELDRVCDCYEAGIQLRVASLRAEHPDWPPKRAIRAATIGDAEAFG